MIVVLCFVQSICHQLDPESAIAAIDSRKAAKYQRKVRAFWCMRVWCTVVAAGN